MDDPMKNSKPPTPLRTSDYEAIEAAMMETERGRWFLSEFTQRNRSGDTRLLLDAISKLEASIKRPDKDSTVEKIRMDLMEMSKAIAETRKEIAAMSPQDGETTQFFEATEELDAIVRATEKATNDILEAAEEIQETAWTMREQGSDAEACDRLDGRATDIYAACSFQDITGQRTSKVVNVLRYLEDRVNSMVSIWGMAEGESGQPQLTRRSDRPDAHLLNGPQRDGHGLDQDDVDSMMFLSPKKESAAEQADASAAGADMADRADVANMEAMEPAAAAEAPAAIFEDPALGEDITGSSEEPGANADTLPAESQALLDELAKSAAGDEDETLLPAQAMSPEQPAEDTAANAAEMSDALLAYGEHEAGAEAKSKETAAEDESNDPDDLLAPKSAAAPKPAQGNGQKRPASAMRQDGVVDEEDFEDPEPLTLSALSANGRAVLFS